VATFYIFSHLIIKGCFMEDSHLSVADKGEGRQINGENVFNLRIIGHKILK